MSLREKIQYNTRSKLSPWGLCERKRHDNIRDFEAQLLKTVCNDVQIEPPLQSVPLGVTLNPGANTKEDARLDVRARGYWRDGQNAYFDVCVTNADCESQRNTSLKQVLRKHDLIAVQSASNANRAWYSNPINIHHYMGHEQRLFEVPQIIS